MPHGLDPKDELFCLAILILQNKYFGPLPAKFFQLLDNEGVAILRYAVSRCGEKTQLFSKAGPEMIDPDDKEFICYLMKADPRDRPSTAEALMHPWLRGV